MVLPKTKYKLTVDVHVAGNSKLESSVSDIIQVPGSVTSDVWAITKTPNLLLVDEELARRLQQQEDINHMAEVQTARSAKYQESKASPTRARKLNSSLVGYGDNKGMIDPLTLPRQSVQETTSLKEIMDEQLAAQLSKDVEVPTYYIIVLNINL